MPILRYTLRVLDDEFSETETFSRTKDAYQAVEHEIVAPMCIRRAALGDPPASLVKVEVLSPCVHRHEWERGSIDRCALKAHYHCKHCEVTGYKRYHLLNGEGGPIWRNEQFRKDKFELCREPLKPIPKQIIF